MKFHSEVFIAILILFLHLCSIAKSEVFTALVDLEPLLYTEGEILKTLGRYLEVEEERLDKIRWVRAEYEKLHNAASKDASSFLSNPVNAYLLVKRLSSDWEFTGRLIEGAQSRAVIENITRQDLRFPDQEDLSGAAAALLRLQDTYLLDTTQLAKGEIEGARVSSELSAGDCFQLGYQAVGMQDYYHTILWMQEALDRLEDEEIKTADKAATLEYAAYATFMLGNVKHAIKLTKDLISIAPDHPRAYFSLQHYQSYIVQYDGQSTGDDDFSTDDSEPLVISKPHSKPSYGNYEKLCRGESLKTPLEESKLFCRYTHKNNSYLLLQPVKEEILSLDPKIVAYHDVISDKDMEIFKELAVPVLSRATVQNPHSGFMETASYRVSKSSWLSNSCHPRVAHASQMIEEITGLETDTAEQLHVINYGIGGHYEPHLDFKQEGDVDGFAHLGTGNRIATWIYYLSDVDAGGSTVFPHIGVQVKPVKGSAAFWYNLKQSGDGDKRTMHAACPVLAGSKWVGNKWLHERGQEFRRPCSLNRWE